MRFFAMFIIPFFQCIPDVPLSGRKASLQKRLDQIEELKQLEETSRIEIEREEYICLHRVAADVILKIAETKNDRNATNILKICQELEQRGRTEIEVMKDHSFYRNKQNFYIKLEDLTERKFEAGMQNIENGQKKLKEHKELENLKDQKEYLEINLKQPQSKRVSGVTGFIIVAGFVVATAVLLYSCFHSGEAT